MQTLTSNIFSHSNTNEITISGPLHSTKKVLACICVEFNYPYHMEGSNDDNVGGYEDMEDKEVQFLVTQ
jgi:hypothetical protein